MKKLLLTGTALITAFAATPASAQLELGLAGHFRGYAVYSKDETAGLNMREFDLRRDAEVHFTGETTLDNGLTVGVHHEIAIGDDTGVSRTDETYAYFSGSWGRVNFGAEDGAAYLLQVAVPSADSNVDGLRPYIQGADAITPLSYQHAEFAADRITYLTPKFNGFQAGFSYAPEMGLNAVGNNLAPMATQNDPNEFDNLWEVAVRWDGEFKGFGLSLGAGYSDSDIETPGALLADYTDGFKTRNVGANVTFDAFSFGVAYLMRETNITNGLGGDFHIEAETWALGAAWDNGPYHAGISYLNSDYGGNIEANRLTVGGGYTFGPGMSFRGAVAHGETLQLVGGVIEDFTQVTLGTNIEF